MPAKPTHTSADPLWLEDIEEQLISLLRASTQRWQKIAVLMIDVEEQALWQGVAASFTAWVELLANKAEVNKSNLWRALKAGRFYNKVRDEAPPETAQAMPELQKLESKASPESLDLVEKISRAASPQLVNELLGNTLAGATTRKELRVAWEDYRPAVPGTARGRARNGQLKEPPTATKPDSIVVGDIMQGLRASHGSFLDGRIVSHQWQVYTNITVELSDTQQVHQIDAVCAERADPEQPRPGLHGVTIRVQAEELADGPALRAYADVVDSVWLAVPDALAKGAQQMMPDWVGVLAYVAPVLSVVRPVSAIPRKTDLRGELALELLKRLL